MKILLENIVELSDRLPQLKKSEVNVGDSIFVKTNNSTYKIKAENNGNYLVSGGWFKKTDLIITELQSMAALGEEAQLKQMLLPFAVYLLNSVTD